MFQVVDTADEEGHKIVLCVCVCLCVCVGGGDGWMNTEDSGLKMFSAL